MNNSKIKITWVNHAGYVLEYKNIALLVDPWHTSTAFNNGWNFISETYFPESLKKKITHIWISHEHPDHFSPNDLKVLKQINKNPITVLFQKTKDKRVLNFLHKLDFKVIEVSDDEKLNLLEDFQVRILKVGQIDSLSVMKIENKTIVNTNDCVLDKIKLNKIKNKLVLNKVDLLLTQFSYASWIGSPQDKSLRLIAAKEKLTQMQEQIKILEPKNTIPFASYIYFCHQDNFYMNDSIVNLKDVKKNLKFLDTTIVILYPGSCYSFDNSHNSDLDYNKYILDFSNIQNKKIFKQSVYFNYNDLLLASKKYLKSLYKKNTIFIVFFYCIFSKIFKFFFKKDFIGFSGTAFYIKDLNLTCSFDWINGLNVISNNDTADVKLSSEDLKFIFDYEYGSSTLSVNGKAEYSSEYEKFKFERTFCIGLINSVGHSLASMTFIQIFQKNKNILGWEKTDPSYF